MKGRALSFGLTLAAAFAVAATAQAPSEGVSIDFEEAPRTEPETDSIFAAPIEQIFKNPALVSGLASGADALNRSVESLMDAVFYSLLDNELNYYLTKRHWFSASLKRDLFSAANGAYVVVDRVELGPRYAQELWRAHDIPVTLGLDGSVEVMQIYLRTDGMRLAEQRALPRWRRWANNWFGILPVLTAVLPPSFNQNEMYDPIRQLETPFVFPLTIDTLYDMPVGSIRSYGITGGVRLPVEFADTLPNDVAKNLDKVAGLRDSLPYSLFKRGEHRINVLRRSEHIAWVGVKDLNRTGHLLSPLVGNRPEILRGALAARLAKWTWVWSGVPVALFPIDLEFEQAMAKLYDQVYEFDLRVPAAREAYLAAVRGDFVPARNRHLDRVEKDLETGVVFHFTRTQDRNESNIRNSPNVAVYKRERRRDRFYGEVEITDAAGKFYVLESQQDLSLKTWDILVGDEETRVRGLAELKVRRVVSKDAPDDPSLFSYAFEATPDPMSMTFTMAIQDRFVNVVEYREYLEQLRFFTKMPLTDVPHVPLRDARRVSEAWRRGYFVEPGREIANLHVTPQHIGGFGAQATLRFTTEQIERIVQTDEDAMWVALAQSFGVDPAPWGVRAVREGLAHQLRWFTSFFLYPVKLFNVRLPQVDVIGEADNAVRQLLAMRSITDPTAKLDAFYRLLDSDHPMHLTRALLDMADAERVPRRVVFSTQPKGSSSADVKAAYGRLNQKVFRDGPPFPEAGRYEQAQSKMAAFYLDQPREAESKPEVARIQVTARDVPAALVAGSVAARHVFVTFNARHVYPDRPLQLFVKVEQAGRLKIGKLLLAEQVLDLVPLPARADRDPDVLTYELWLTGPLSPLRTYFFEDVTAAGEEFLVTMAVSADGNVWSPERQLEFRFENGRLMKPE